MSSKPDEELKSDMVSDVDKFLPDLKMKIEDFEEPTPGRKIDCNILKSEVMHIIESQNV
jgi:hypothetical protein